MSEHATEQTGNDQPEAQLGRWQKVMLGLAILFIVVGGALRFTADSSASDPQPAGAMSAQSGGGAGNSSLVGDGQGGFKFPDLNGSKGEPGSASAAADDSPSSWSPMFLKGGLSFALFFAIGYALRTFFKMATFAIGALALGIFALSYWGGVDLSPAIDSMSGAWDTVVGKVQEQAGDFKQFMTGHMPSAGGATLGLVSGFKKG